MAETIKIERSINPIKIKQESSINPVNLDKLFTHNENEIKKIYDLFGGNGIINQASITRIIISSGGGGGASGAPADAIFLMIGNDSRFSKERALVSNQGVKQVDGGANGNLVLSADINALTEKTEPTNVDFVMIYDAAGLNNKKVTVDKLGSEYWQDPVIDTLTTPPI